MNNTATSAAGAEGLIRAVLHHGGVDWSSQDASENRQDISAEDLLGASIHHGVTLLLYARLKPTASWQTWPAGLCRKLKQHAQSAATRDLLRGHETAAVLVALADAGVAPLLPRVRRAVPPRGLEDVAVVSLGEPPLLCNLTCPLLRHGFQHRGAWRSRVPILPQYNPRAHPRLRHGLQERRVRRLRERLRQKPVEQPDQGDNSSHYSTHPERLPADRRAQRSAARGLCTDAPWLRCEV
jgi:hypothetical protein